MISGGKLIEGINATEFVDEWRRKNERFYAAYQFVIFQENPIFCAYFISGLSLFRRRWRRRVGRLLKAFDATLSSMEDRSAIREHRCLQGQITGMKSKRRGMPKGSGRADSLGGFLYDGKTLKVFPS